jgi:hypothetical protein
LVLLLLGRRGGGLLVRIVVTLSLLLLLVVVLLLLRLLTRIVHPLERLRRLTPLPLLSVQAVLIRRRRPPSVCSRLCTKSRTDTTDGEDGRVRGVVRSGTAGRDEGGSGGGEGDGKTGRSVVSSTVTFSNAGDDARRSYVRGRSETRVVLLLIVNVLVVVRHRVERDVLPLVFGESREVPLVPAVSVGSGESFRTHLSAVVLVDGRAVQVGGFAAGSSLADDTGAELGEEGESVMQTGRAGAEAGLTPKKQPAREYMMKAARVIQMPCKERSAKKGRKRENLNAHFRVPHFHQRRCFQSASSRCKTRQCRR